MFWTLPKNLPQKLNEVNEAANCGMWISNLSSFFVIWALWPRHCWRLLPQENKNLFVLERLPRIKFEALGCFFRVRDSKMVGRDETIFGKADSGRKPAVAGLGAAAAEAETNEDFFVP